MLVHQIPAIEATVTKINLGIVPILTSMSAHNVCVREAVGSRKSFGILRVE
jgi:hypothetical protein